MVELFAGRYAFVDLLGSGGMGTVWRVWDVRRQEYCAAKVLSRADSTSLLRFIRETSWRVEHRHVLTPTGWAAEDDQVLFTMPLLHGGTVADLVRDFGALPDPLAVDLLRQVLEALVAVHAAGLVHRDVKPSNLLLDPPGTGRPHLHLSDFGIATRVDEPRLTRLGEAVGTRGYTAPEVLTGADPDPAQDLYAVGVVALELLTGRRPAPHGPPSTEELDGHPLRPLVERMLQPLPAGRPSAVEALDALPAAGAGAPGGGDEQVEVFDQVPELPEGWSSAGPAGDAPALPPMPAPEPPPSRTRTSPTEAAPAAAPTAVLETAGPPASRAATAAPPAPGRGRRLLLPVLAVLLLLAGIAAVAGGLALLG